MPTPGGRGSRVWGWARGVSSVRRGHRQTPRKQVGTHTGAWGERGLTALGLFLEGRPHVHGIATG